MATGVTGTGELTQDINVLPLIDVLLVLIIIFMLLLRDLIFIPAEIPPPAAGGDGDRDPQIVLELRADRSFRLNGQPIPATHLDAQLHAIYEQRPVKLLFISAAEELPYQDMIRAMDRARGAGVEVIAWVPRTFARQRP